MKKATLFAAAAGLLMAGALMTAAVPVPAYASETETKQAAAAGTTGNESTPAQASKGEEAAAGTTGNESTQAATGDAAAKTGAAEAGSTAQKAEEITVKLGYEHDPMENPKAAQDIIVNHDAVYGYSPSPLSTRLKEFVDYIDWTNDAEVEEARNNRIRYYETEEVLYQTIETMMDEGKSIEEIARAVSQKRNEIRMDAYIGDADGLARLKKSNLDTYGNEEGPTIDYLYEKYGSWETILQKALSSNPGMDACLGLYDDFYEFYSIEEKVTLKAMENVTTTDAATGVKTYKVVKGDNLWKIAQKVYGDGTKWEAIYEKNKDKLSDPSKLTVGMDLVIPELPQKESTAKAGTAATAATTAAASTATTAAAAATTGSTAAATIASTAAATTAAK